MPFLPEDFHEGNPLAAEIMDHGIEIELEQNNIAGLSTVHFQKMLEL